jgi:hypothetical protein
VLIATPFQSLPTSIFFHRVKTSKKKSFHSFELGGRYTTEQVATLPNQATPSEHVVFQGNSSALRLMLIHKLRVPVSTYLCAFGWQVFSSFYCVANRVPSKHQNIFTEF